MELDVAQLGAPRPSAGEGEAVVDKPEHTVRHPLLARAARRHVVAPRAGERGAEPHVHREHTDAFYVLEGELTFRIGPDLEPVTAPAGTFVAVPPNVIHGFDNDGYAASLLPQLPCAERRLRRLPARREPRVRQLRSARGRRRVSGHGDRLPARSGRTARARQPRATSSRPKLPTPGGDRAVVRARLRGRRLRTRTTTHVDSFFVLDGEMEFWQRHRRPGDVRRRSARGGARLQIADERADRRSSTSTRPTRDFTASASGPPLT